MLSGAIQGGKRKKKKKTLYFHAKQKNDNFW